MKPVICHYCKQEAELVTGREVYPHLPKLAHKKIWRCLPCQAWVGTHENSKDHKPLGILANKSLRDMKMRAHMVFDPLWKDMGMKRVQAYKRLAEALGIPTNKCHIGMFDEEMCQKVINVCRGWAREASNR